MIDVKSLHPLEIKVLKNCLQDEVISTDYLVEKLNYTTGHANQSVSWLLAKNLIVSKEQKALVTYEITENGLKAQKEGLPHEKIIHLIKEKGKYPFEEIAGFLSLEKSDVGSSFGLLKKEGILDVDENKNVVIKTDKESEDVKGWRSLLDKGVQVGCLLKDFLNLKEQVLISKISRKRGSDSYFRENERTVVYYQFTKEAKEVKKLLEKANITGDELGVNSKEIITSGKWKDIPFREYALNAPIKRLFPGRANPYSQFISDIKDKLSSMGFEEFDGPLVENEFWNGDALFMPQFHSARDIHDVYYVKDPMFTNDIEEKWLKRVKETHENGGECASRGWQYKFDTNFSKRQLLRSQGTVLSAHQLTKTKIPGKYFGVVRCFRYDQVDATHGADFYQTEGIVVSEHANLKTLLGLLEMFAKEIAGADEVKYVPGYFPFTEPSVEVHIKHPVLGWFELGGSGIFRPEVTKTLGVDVPVIAWGMGIDRMALMHLGLNDLRDLFDYDLEKVRQRRNTNAKD